MQGSTDMPRYIPAPPSGRLTSVFVVIASLLLTMCRSDQGPSAPTEVGTGPRASFQFNASTVSLVGAGNIARCDRTNDEATANLLDGISGTVFTLGDNAYPNGSAANFTCDKASRGRHKARTYPAN